MYKNILESYNNKNSEYSSLRICDIIQGILLVNGILKPGEPFNFKNIEYTRKYFLFWKKTFIRKQSYKELIIEKFNELINKLENE